MPQPSERGHAQSTVARTIAHHLLEIGAVHIRPSEPFTLTSGYASPVYVDCRKPISFPAVRRAVIDAMDAHLTDAVGRNRFDVVAGGETAGIPYAAWLADRLDLPMVYVRKKPKGFGRNAQIEGQFDDGARVLLVEDLASDGKSKLVFAEALRQAGAKVEHVIVVFFYAAFAGGLATLRDAGLTLHALATWTEVLEVAAETGLASATDISEVRAFLSDPAAWSRAHGGAG